MMHRTTSAVTLLITASAKPIMGSTRYALSNQDGLIGANFDYFRPQVILDTMSDYDVVTGNADEYGFADQKANSTSEVTVMRETMIGDTFLA